MMSPGLPRRLRPRSRLGLRPNLSRGLCAASAPQHTPAGVRSIAMMRACLVAGRAADFDDAGVGRLRDLDLLDFGEAERVAALAVDLGLVMGSSEVHATPSAAPPQPRRASYRAGPDPDARPSRSKTPQQRSDHARKLVISEQDSCSLVG